MKRSLPIFLLLIAIATITYLSTSLSLSTSKKSHEEYFQTGMTALAQGDLELVKQCADHLKEQPEFESHEKLLSASYLLKIKQPAAALKLLSQVDPVGDLRAPALLAAGESLYLLNRLAEAQGLFAKLASEEPGHVDSHRWLAAVAYDLGDLDRALDELGIVIRLQPADFRPHLLLGQMKYDLEQYADAVVEYKKALEKKPPQNLTEKIAPLLARSQTRVREYADAINTLKATTPSAETLALEAECEMSLGHMDKARSLVAQVKGINEHQVDMLKVAARIEMDEGHPAAAIAPLRSILRLDAQDHETRHLLSQALRLTGKVEEADKEAQTTAQTLEFKRQLSQLTQDAIAKPTDPEIREKMAEICSQMGKLELAASWKKAAEACRQINTRP